MSVCLLVIGTQLRVEAMYRELAAVALTPRFVRAIGEADEGLVRTGRLRASGGRTSAILRRSLRKHGRITCKRVGNVRVTEKDEQQASFFSDC